MPKPIAGRQRFDEIDGELARLFVAGCMLQIAVGRLMLELIDHPLYLEGRTFDEYCEQRWGIDGAMGRKWAEAAEVADANADNVRDAALLYVAFLDDFNPKHASILASVPESIRERAWSEIPHAVEDAAAKMIEDAHASVAADVGSMTKDEELAHLQQAEATVGNAITMARSIEIAERTKKALTRAFREMREERYAKTFKDAIKHADAIEKILDEIATPIYAED